MNKKLLYIPHTISLNEFKSNKYLLNYDTLCLLSKKLKPVVRFPDAKQNPWKALIEKPSKNSYLGYIKSSGMLGLSRAYIQKPAFLCKTPALEKVAEVEIFTKGTLISPCEAEILSQIPSNLIETATVYDFQLKEENKTYKYLENPKAEIKIFEVLASLYKFAEGEKEPQLVTDIYNGKIPTPYDDMREYYYE